MENVTKKIKKVSRKYPFVPFVCLYSYQVTAFLIGRRTAVLNRGMKMCCFLADGLYFNMG